MQWTLSEEELKAIAAHLQPTEPRYRFRRYIGYFRQVIPPVFSGGFLGLEVHDIVAASHELAVMHCQQCAQLGLLQDRDGKDLFGYKLVRLIDVESNTIVWNLDFRPKVWG